MPSEVGSATFSSSMVTNLPEPTLVHDMGVNALNYCAYDMTLTKGDNLTLKGWLVTPHTLDSAWLDVYELPSQRRIVEALGRNSPPSTSSIVPGPAAQERRPPVVMSLQTCFVEKVLWIIAGYEDGSLRAWTTSLSTSEPMLMWAHKSHAEAIMAICVSPKLDSVLSVGADYHIVRTSLTPNAVPEVHKVRRPGNACVGIRWDERVCVVGGWDACVRVYAWPLMEKLAKLSYHKSSIYSLAYTRFDPAHVLDVSQDGDSSSNGSSDEADAGSFGMNSVNEPSAKHLKKRQPHSKMQLLACGSKDGRISLWKIPFTPEDEQQATHLSQI